MKLHIAYLVLLGGLAACSSSGDRLGLATLGPGDTGEDQIDGWAEHITGGYSINVGLFDPGNMPSCSDASGTTPAIQIRLSELDASAPGTYQLSLAPTDALDATKDGMSIGGESDLAYTTGSVTLADVGDAFTLTYTAMGSGLGTVGGTITSAPVCE